MRIRVQEEVTVPFAAHQVWAVLADVHAYAAWWPARLDVRVIRAETDLVGTELEVRPLVGHPFRYRLEEADPPSILRLRFLGGSLDGPGGFALESAAAVTTVRYSIDAFARGLDLAVVSTLLSLERNHAFQMRALLRGLERRLIALGAETERAAGLPVSTVRATAVVKRPAVEAQRPAAQRGGGARETEERIAVAAMLRMKAEQATARLASARAAARVRAEAQAKRVAEEIAARLAAEREAARIAAEAEEKRIAEEIAARLAAEREAARMAAEAETEREAGRLAAEVEMKRIAEAAVARITAEREAARLAAQAQAKRIAEQAEATRIAEETAARIAAEREAARLAAEAEVRRVAEETAARILAEREAARVAAEAEMKRIAYEAVARIAAEREAARLAAEAEMKRIAYEAAARVTAEREATRIAAEAEAKRIARLAEEAEAARIAEEAAARLAAERDAARLAAEAERKRVAEAAARVAAEREAARLAAEAEARRVTEEAVRIAAERQAARLSAEAEARRIARETAASLAAERKAARLEAEGEARHIAREAAARVAAAREAFRLAEEAEAKRIAQEAAKIAQEEMALIVAEEDAARLVTEKTAPLLETNATPRLTAESLRSGLRNLGRWLRAPANPSEKEATDLPQAGPAGDSNFSIARRYLEALSSRATPADLAAFFADDVILEEFPHRLLAHKTTRRLSEILQARAEDLAGFTSQVFELTGATGGGSQVALEVRWRASETLGGLGRELEAHSAIFLVFTHGRIARQRTYTCLDPWFPGSQGQGGQREPARDSGSGATESRTNQALRRPGIMGSNFEIARSLLGALNAGASPEEIAAFYAEDAVREEFPNRRHPGGRRLDLAAIKAGRSEDLSRLAAESYDLQGATGGESQVAMEIDWSATVRVNHEPPGGGKNLTGRRATFLQFRDGLIVRQRDYDCP